MMQETQLDLLDPLGDWMDLQGFTTAGLQW
jgi:hypothetical protein